MAGKPTDVIEDWTYGPVRWIGAGLVVGAAAVGTAWSVSARRVEPSEVRPAIVATQPLASSVPVTPAPSAKPVTVQPIVTELPPRVVEQPPAVVAIEKAAETKPAPVPAAPRADRSPININSATQAQLEELPGIGPGLALRIIEDRAKNGRFRSVQDLDRVRGIGPKLMEKLRPLVVAE